MVAGTRKTESGHFIADTPAGAGYAVTTPLKPLDALGLMGDFSMVSNLKIPWSSTSVDAGKVEQCFVQHLLTFAEGRELRPEEDSAKQALLASFKSSGYNLQQLLTDYATDDRFVLRQEEVTP